MTYAVVRTDNMSGTVDGSLLKSCKYYNGTSYADIENGNVVVLDSMISGEREIWKTVTPAVDTPASKVVLVAGVEELYDVNKHNVNEYINVKELPFRGYLLHNGDVFSVTADALSGASIAAGNIVELQAGTKLSAVATATVGSTVIGKVIQVESVSGVNMYVIQVTI